VKKDLVFPLVEATSLKMPFLKLVSEDNEEFLIDAQVASSVSKVIANMIEGYPVEEKEEEVPISNVTGKTLSLIMKWTEHYYAEYILAGIDAPKGLTEWDSDFMAEWNLETIFDVFKACISFLWHDISSGNY